MLCERPRRSCRRRELLNQPWIGACSQPPLRAIGTKREGGIAGDIPAGPHAGSPQGRVVSGKYVSTLNERD